MGERTVSLSYTATICQGRAMPIHRSNAGHPSGAVQVRSAKFTPVQFTHQP